MFAVASLTYALQDRYCLERELGAGGMATVYLAQDMKHDRPVALKVLRPELAVVLGAERFLREIRITAQLTHLHILPLLDSGEADGFLYYVMPYVEGESLRERLTREPQLPLEEALAFTNQVASALDCAHQQGIVHRDIKPENILLSSGEAVVADFGIALAVRAAAGERLTVTGLSLGTPQYMSPEQASGSREVDARSDVYSLGAVLYEMLVGEPPHTGPTVEALLAKLLTQVPVEPRAARSAIPEHVNRAVLKALAKQPVDRYATAGEFAAALVAPAEVAAEKSIVVLPFENLSPDPDNAFFADGLTDEIITDLSGIRALRIISRSSAMTFRGTAKRAPEIARELGVQYVLEGGVRREKKHLRITAQLIDAGSDAHLWAEKYTGTVEDVFELQERLSRRIVAALRIALSPDEDRQLAARPFEKTRGWDCYVQAWREVLRFTEEALDRALRLVNEAISIEGENALLYACLASVHWGYYNCGFRSDEETLALADALCARALKLDPDLGPAHLATGLVMFVRGNLQADARHMLRAVERGAGADALAHLATVCALAGRSREARQYADRAIALDPLGVLSLYDSGAVDLVNGDLEGAARWFARGLEVAPGNPLSLFHWAVTKAYARDEAEAGSCFNELAAGSGPFAHGGALYRTALRGDRAAVLRLLGSPDVLPHRHCNGHVSWWIADCLARVGDAEEALRWLDNAIRLGRINSRFWSEVDPFVASLSGNPGFEALMERAREKERAFEV